MENLNFIDPLLHGITPVERTTSKLTIKNLVCAGIGAIVVGSILKKTGHNKSAAVLGGIALPLLATAACKKIASVKKEKIDQISSSGIEYNH